MKVGSITSFLPGAILGLIGCILFSEYSQFWGAILLGLGLVLLGVVIFFDERHKMSPQLGWSILGFFTFLSGILILAGTLGGGGR